MFFLGSIAGTLAVYSHMGWRLQCLFKSNAHAIRSDKLLVSYNFLSISTDSSLAWEGCVKYHAAFKASEKQILVATDIFGHGTTGAHPNVKMWHPYLLKISLGIKSTKMPSFAHLQKRDWSIWTLFLTTTTGNGADEWMSIGSVFWHGHLSSPPSQADLTNLYHGPTIFTTG
ncbi:hypothetical protein BKA82DRAFT_4018762 [Pisolithus tinctorius]|nr:hypothetical protein BKA82DRAFT_4018762 [Pisolithus tinctorius]